MPRENWLKENFKLKGTDLAFRAVPTYVLCTTELYCRKNALKVVTTQIKDCRIDAFYAVCLK